MSLNPYNVFANEQITDSSCLHTKSPLRNSFQPDESTQSPSWERSPSNTSAPSADTPNRQRLSISSPALPAPTHQIYFDAALLEPLKRSLDCSIPRSSSSPAATSPTSLAETNLQSNPTQRFRELMPSPRDLPFKKRQKTQPSPKAPRRPETQASEARPASPISRGRGSPKRRQVIYTDQSTYCDIRQPSRETAIPSTDSSVQSQSQDDPDASSSVQSQSQGESATSISVGSSLGLAQLSSSQSSQEAQPTIIIADPSLLKEVSEQTNSLLDQYEADVARGCDKAVYAKFYMDRIDAVRREFSLRKLADAKSWN